MKKFEYDAKRQAWDLFNQFHVLGRVFTEFDNGSLIVHNLPDPHERRVYEQYGIQLVTTTDADCPELFLRPDATTPLKKAWISQGGQQHLAIDLKQKKAIRLRETWANFKNSEVLPYNISKYAKAFWSKPDVDPTPLNEITVSLPDRVVRNSLGKKLKDVQAAITAIYRIQSAAQQRHYWQAAPMQALYAWDNMTVEEIVADITKNENAAGQITHNIATCGFTYPRAEQRYEYLYIK